MSLILYWMFKGAFNQGAPGKSSIAASTTGLGEGPSLLIVDSGSALRRTHTDGVCSNSSSSLLSYRVHGHEVSN